MKYPSLTLHCASKGRCPCRPLVWHLSLEQDPMVFLGGVLAAVAQALSVLCEQHLLHWEIHEFYVPMLRHLLAGGVPVVEYDRVTHDQTLHGIPIHILKSNGH